MLKNEECLPRFLTRSLAHVTIFCVCVCTHDIQGAFPCLFPAVKKNRKQAWALKLIKAKERILVKQILMAYNMNYLLAVSTNSRVIKWHSL